jgi:hypothetical protein
MFAPFGHLLSNGGPVFRRFIRKLYAQRSKIGLNNTMKTKFMGGGKCLRTA